MAPADPERRDDHRRARWRWRWRPHRRGRSRQAARPARLRRAAPRRSRARQERRRSERRRLGWPKDVAGAIRFLTTRDEVDPERIGALGLSTGADVLIQVAAQGTDLKAVVADGAYAASFKDTQRIMGFTPITPFAALEFATVAVTSGTTPGPAIEDVMKRITSPLLLVAAGPPEKDAGELYDRAAGDRAVDVLVPARRRPHSRPFRDAAPEYEERVTTFSDAALTRP